MKISEVGKNNPHENYKIGVSFNFLKLHTNLTESKLHSMRRNNLRIRTDIDLPQIKSINKSQNILHTEPSDYFLSLSYKINKSREKLKKLKIQNLIEELLDKKEKKIRKYDFNLYSGSKIEAAKSSRQVMFSRNTPKVMVKKKVVSESEKMFPEKYGKQNMVLDKFSKIFINSKDSIADSINKKFYEGIKPKVLHFKKREFEFKNKSEKNLKIRSIETQVDSTSLNLAKFNSPLKFMTVRENDFSTYHEQKRTSNNVSLVSIDEKEHKLKYEIEQYKSIKLKSKYHPVVNLKKFPKFSHNDNIFVTIDKNLDILI
jgi:hypothetical protein